MRTTSLACLCLCLFGLAALLPAQALVVDPGGGGNFTQLQPAIDAAAPGAIILVRGGSYDPVRIDKSLTILGEPRFEIYQNQHQAPCPSGPGGICQAPALDLSGSGADSLVLVNARIHGWTPFPFNYSAPMLRSQGFAEIWIEDCELQNHGWSTLTGSARGTPAIAIDSAMLWLIRSTAVGQPSDVDSCASRFGHDGPEGIAAPNSTVVLMDSIVIGGNGSYSCFNGGAPTAAPCPCPGGTGSGGPGILANEVLTAGSVVSGGRGGQVVFRTWPGQLVLPWGRQPDGQAFVVNRKIDLLPSLDGGRARIGQAWVLTHRGIGTNTVFVGLASPAPWQLLSYGWGFFDPSLPFFTVRGNPGASHTIPIPSDPNLLGLKLSAQHCDNRAFALMQPVLATITP